MRIAILLLGALGLWGQETARIEGVVVSAAGEPVARAKVRLAGLVALRDGKLGRGPAYEANSDEAGKFVLEDIQPDEGYTLTAEKTGFIVGRFGARSANGPAVLLDLEPRQALGNLIVTLMPQGAINGRVVDVNGDPVQRAGVGLYRLGYQRGVRQLMTVPLNATTDDRGEYRLASLAPGRYVLVASQSPVSPTRSGDLVPVNTFFPNAADVRDAKVVDLAVGQEVRGLQIQLRQERIYSVAGTLVDMSGAPLGSAGVIATQKIKDSSTALPRTWIATTKADGTFIFNGLTPGSYTAQASRGSVIETGTRIVGAAEFTVVDHEITGVAIRMTRGASIGGSVRVEGGDLKDLLPHGSPAGDLTPHFTLALAAAGTAYPGAPIREGALAIRLIGPGAFPPIGVGVVKEDGRFLAENLYDAKYQVTIVGLPANIYIKSARSGREEVAGSIEVTSSGGMIDVVLAKNAATVSGTTEAGVTVALWTQVPDAGLLGYGIRTVVSNRKGDFQFQNLAPGVYFLAALDGIESNLVQVRDFLTQLIGDAVKLEVKEGDALSQGLKAIPAEKLKAAEESLP